MIIYEFNLIQFSINSDQVKTLQIGISNLVLILMYIYIYMIHLLN